MMNEQEQIEMMRRCRDEIRQLRAQIAVLAPKAEAYDNMSKLISVAIRQPSEGMGEDVAWQLEKRLSEIEAKRAARSAATT